MPTFGTESEKMLVGVHPTLVSICRMAIKVMDFSVVDGVRTLEEQRANLARGKSWTMDSKHLPQADGFSHAVDLAPYPTVWADTEEFCVLAGVMKAAAFTAGVVLRWGGDWNSNMSTLDEAHRDFGHFELVQLL